jgi:hypothetical protein
LIFSEGFLLNLITLQSSSKLLLLIEKKQYGNLQASLQYENSFSAEGRD